MSNLARTATEAVKAAVRAKVIAWLAGILVPVLLVVAGVLVLILLFVVVFGGAGDDDQGAGCPAGAPASVTERQNYYARLIIGVARSAFEGPDADKAAVIAMMTVAQESSFQNLANDGVWTIDRDRAVTAEQVAAVSAASLALSHDGVGTDNDSVNLFQQRPFAGWGVFPGRQPDPFTLATHVQRLMNPVWAAQVFFLHLQQVQEWQSMELGAVAQAVQVSAYPDAYSRHQPLAEALLTTNTDAPAIDLVPTDAQAIPFDMPALGDGPVSLCGGRGAVDGSAASVIAAARSQIGQPYSWGGGEIEGPGGGCGCAPFPGDRSVIGFDCSGLARYAIYQGTGLQMGRTSRDQYRDAESWGFDHVAYTSTNDLRAGDLVFFAKTSDPGDIYHVAIATGDGTYVEARNHSAGVVEGPMWTAPSMWVVRPPYGQIGKEG